MKIKNDTAFSQSTGKNGLMLTITKKRDERFASHNNHPFDMNLLLSINKLEIKG